ncbi:MAG: tryptophan synthase subunit alpha [Verrucomicrobiae bacterium]|nr:tryptophan synthase subunit alpha [Verrucomicrobiae bacterium]
MINRIDQKFEEIRREDRKGFVAYLTAGDPDLATTFEVAQTLEKAGVDILELGVPFSDPVADGVVIQMASQRALESGTTLRKIIARVGEFRRTSQMPIVLFTYFNPVHQYGLETLLGDAARAGVDGVLLLDLPPEDAAGAETLMAQHHLRKIALIAPTTTPARAARICAGAGGFIYYISREGVTGMQSAVNASLEERVAALRVHTPLPIAVGFGVSNAGQARTVAMSADAVVVGSAIVDCIGRHGKAPDLCGAVEQFVRPMVAAVRSVKNGG